MFKRLKKKKCERKVMLGQMGKRKQQAVTLGHVLVGVLNPGGCSHTRFFVVFVLHREKGYFPEPGRRISIAWPSSSAAHMTSNAGKPLKTAQKEVREEMMGTGRNTNISFHHCCRVLQALCTLQMIILTEFHIPLI